jgi:hypothetical protein
VNLSFIDWIWHIRGSLPLASGQSSKDAFDRLAPLFQQRGTSHQMANGILTFSKKDQAAQDKMSIFDDGTLQIDRGAAGPMLRYHLISRALLLCFLAPFVFVGIAQLTIAINNFDKTPPPAKSAAAKKPAAVPMNPVDKFLHAPAPDASKKDVAPMSKKGGKPTPTPAYVFATFFAILYVVGRILEDRLIRGLFRKSLLGTDTHTDTVSTMEMAR